MNREVAVVLEIVAVLVVQGSITTPEDIVIQGTAVTLEDVTTPGSVMFPEVTEIRGSVEAPGITMIVRTWYFEPCIFDQFDAPSPNIPPFTSPMFPQ